MPRAQSVNGRGKEEKRDLQGIEESGHPINNTCIVHLLHALVQLLPTSVVYFHI